MKNFSEWMGAHQATWRRGRVSTAEDGLHGGKPYPRILPPGHWEESLWEPLRSGGACSLPQYLKQHQIEKHTGANNLNSSWVACANLYFPFRWTPEGRSLLARFLHSNVSNRIDSVEAVELEYAEDGPLHPETLLGESGGSRGSGQTSPDLAFVVNAGTGIVLTESKLTEHSFYRCSARTTTEKPGRPANPHPARCLNAEAVATAPELECHQVAWGRNYWERLKGAIDLEAVGALRACPAALGGYQLFRQQALAEGYTSKYNLVVSAVAYDARNDDLVNSLRSTGISSFPEGWAKLFKGKAGFAAWTHQAWVDWVREQQRGEWSAWLAWIETRYGYGTGVQGDV